jgi:hypothetical protein
VGVEPLIGELVLDGEMRACGAALHVGEAREEVWQWHPTRHGHNPCVPTDVPLSDGEIWTTHGGVNPRGLVVQRGGV